MVTEELKIEGMSCDHCVMSVRKELAKLAGLHVDEITIGTARVQYDEARVKHTDLARAVEAAGYRLVS